MPVLRQPRRCGSQGERLVARLHEEVHVPQPVPQKKLTIKDLLESGKRGASKLLSQEQVQQLGLDLQRMGLEIIRSREPTINRSRGRKHLARFPRAVLRLKAQQLLQDYTYACLLNGVPVQTVRTNSW